MLVLFCNEDTIPSEEGLGLKQSDTLKVFCNLKMVDPTHNSGVICGVELKMLLLDLKSRIEFRNGNHWLYIGCG